MSSHSLTDYLLSYLSPLIVRTLNMSPRYLLLGLNFCSKLTTIVSMVPELISRTSAESQAECRTPIWVQFKKVAQRLLIVYAMSS